MGSFSETAGILFPGSAAILIGCGALVLFGMLWNVCNIVMIVPQLCQSKDRQCVDFIILCISVSNVLLDISAFGYLFINQFELHCHTELHTIIRIVFYVFFSATCLSFWSITWLCVFYCVKIVSFPMAFFVKLKRNIPSVINVALILTVVSCLILYIPFFFFSLPTHEENDTLNIKCPELSVHFSKPINRNLYLYTFLCFLCPIPLSFMLTTSISLVSHLCKHTRSMKKNETSFQSRNAYMLIVKMIISLVVVYLVTIIMAFICFIIQEKSTDLANHIIIPNMAFFCLATGVLLTITNKNLKEKFMAACCCKKTQTDPANLSERLN
ncbi:taste receptor type 2 member 40-like [Amia ocellicauda]|uniref:taste receptor type 2 member 40-like n=1 Tax=Amia ocellicauda TaxID=2972642 RepID=UPI0034643F4E|nr:T2R41 protein [Amia calva]